MGRARSTGDSTSSVQVSLGSCQLAQPRVAVEQLWQPDGLPTQVRVDLTSRKHSRLQPIHMVTTRYVGSSRPTVKHQHGTGERAEIAGPERTLLVTEAVWETPTPAAGCSGEATLSARAKSAVLPSDFKIQASEWNNLGFGIERTALTSLATMQRDSNAWAFQWAL
jgi:hypothetical protein